MSATKFLAQIPNVSLGFVDCSLYTRRVMLKEGYQRKRMLQLAYAPVEHNYIETLAKTYIIPALQDQFFREKIFNSALLRRRANAMTSNPAFTGSLAENSL